MHEKRRTKKTPRSLESCMPAYFVRPSLKSGEDAEEVYFARARNREWK